MPHDPSLARRGEVCDDIRQQAQCANARCVSRAARAGSIRGPSQTAAPVCGRLRKELRGNLCSGGREEGKQAPKKFLKIFAQRHCQSWILIPETAQRPRLMVHSASATGMWLTGFCTHSRRARVTTFGMYCPCLHTRRIPENHVPQRLAGRHRTHPARIVHCAIARAAASVGAPLRSPRCTNAKLPRLGCETLAGAVRVDSVRADRFGQAARDESPRDQLGRLTPLNSG